LSPQLSRAAQWWLHSGIQLPSGGVARYYRSDLQRNHSVSTEITGYAVSTLVYLHSLTGDPQLLERARSAACFLVNAWDSTISAIPFELDPADATYYFDCGIIVRGLLAAWRATGAYQFRETAAAIGSGMLRDFSAADGGFHPILGLPAKTPAPRDADRWSRCPGCYQLKSAMAWYDLGEATGAIEFRSAYEDAVQFALRTCGSFLPGHSESAKVMDRLHAYAYFLEGLLPLATRPDCARALDHGIARVAEFLRQIAPEFERSDVYAQLLRIRIYADSAGVAPLDRAAAEWEAARLAEFQAESPDPRIAGGFYFGRRASDRMPYLNPVSTAFALQALALWDDFRHGAKKPTRRDLLI